jgi:regulator of protease activity HflC (stomatin/prohibitin superfamily)
MNNGIKAVAWIMSIFVTLGLLDWTLRLMSEKSDIAFWGGLLATIIIVVVWILILIKKGKEFVKKMQKQSTFMSLILVALIGVMGLGTTGCTRVGPAEAGIEVSLAGSDRGVQDIPLVTGWVFYNPLGTDIITYPTFVQTAVWTQDTTEGSPTNEEITFNSKEGLIISGDISMSYSIVRDSVPKFYVKFRTSDLNTFTHGFVRNIARDAFNAIGVRFTVEEIYGEKKGVLLDSVRALINRELNAYGVHVEQFGILKALRIPLGVTEALNAKITATQNAIRAENELRQTEAEAKKAIAKAEGEARSNEVLTRSITPELIKWRNLQVQEQIIAKWDGRRPMVEGAGSNLLFTLPSLNPTAP